MRSKVNFYSILTVFLAAIEEETYRERYCDDSLPGAWGDAVHPQNHPLSLPARVYNCPSARALHGKHLLSVRAIR